MNASNVEILSPTRNNATMAGISDWNEACCPHHKDQLMTKHDIHIHLHITWKSHTSLGSLCDNGAGCSKGPGVKGMKNIVISSSVARPC